MALLELGRGDVDLVEGRVLLAVDLDGDEMGVEDRRHRLVVEALLLHHMAPVAGGVADREEDRAVEGCRLGQRIRPPGAPVDRVVGVLDQVGRGLEDQPVEVFRPATGVEQVGAGDVIRALGIVGGLQPFGQRRVAADADGDGGGWVGGHGGPSCRNSSILGLARIDNLLKTHS